MPLLTSSWTAGENLQGGVWRFAKFSISLYISMGIEMLVLNDIFHHYYYYYYKIMFIIVVVHIFKNYELSTFVTGGMFEPF